MQIFSILELLFFGPKKQLFLLPASKNSTRFMNNRSYTRFTLERKKSYGFSARNIKVKAALPPIYPIEAPYSVLRPPNPDEIICLEDDGLIGLKLNFTVSDRKRLKIKPKGRQMTLLFKAQVDPIAPVLNSWLSNDLYEKFRQRNLFNVSNISETIRGVFQGVLAEGTLNHDEINAKFKEAGKEIDGTFANDPQLYMQVICHVLYLD
jgi:hypothetical protein